MNPLIINTPKGLYCPAGNFYIDPHRAVENAVTTHAHSDHARRGCKQYFAHKSSVGLLKCRLGQNISVRGHEYGENFYFGNVKLSFHSAGHILGSAQVRIEYQGEVWEVSGDYKREVDPTCEEFEVVECDTFITEATFGTPHYKWDSKKTLKKSIGEDIFSWWKTHAKKGVNCLLFGYSLGKAQRILGELYPYFESEVLIHDSIHDITECYRSEGIQLCRTKKLSEVEVDEDSPLEGELILAPPAILKTDWHQKLGRYTTAFASGWMQDTFSRGRYDTGFVMSDHADWPALVNTVLETRAKNVYVQHRGNGALVKHLRTQGLNAHPVEALDEEHHQVLMLF